MMQFVKAALFLAIASISTSAVAQESGLILGLRASNGIPMGQSTARSRLAGLVAGAIPFQLDAGYRFDRYWTGGAYFAWGPSIIASGAKSNLESVGAEDVRGHTVQRLGLQGFYNFEPKGPIAPWFGLGVGYEWTRYAQGTAQGKGVELGVSGFEGILQFGADYRLGSAFAVGPFASLSLGQFKTIIDTRPSGGEAGTIDSKLTALHEWLHLGIRGRFDL